MGENNKITSGEIKKEEALVIQPVAEENDDATIPERVIEKVSLEQLADWKSDGDYEKLESHIRNGNLELLPKEELFRLVLKNREHQVFVNTLKTVLKSFQPLLEKQEALSAYIDRDSKLKINIGKLFEEVLSVQNLNPFNKKEPKPLPIVALFQDAILIEELKALELEALDLTLKNNQINLKPFMGLLHNLGLIDEIPENNSGLVND